MCSKFKIYIKIKFFRKPVSYLGYKANSKVYYIDFATTLFINIHLIVFIIYS